MFAIFSTKWNANNDGGRKEREEWMEKKTSRKCGRNWWASFVCTETDRRIVYVRRTQHHTHTRGNWQTLTHSSVHRTHIRFLGSDFLYKCPRCGLRCRYSAMPCRQNPVYDGLFILLLLISMVYLHNHLYPWLGLTICACGYKTIYSNSGVRWPHAYAWSSRCGFSRIYGR